MMAWHIGSLHIGRSGHVNARCNEDARGLPVVTFTGEDGLLGDEPRTCRIIEAGPDRQPMLVMAAPSELRSSRLKVLVMTVVGGVAGYMSAAIGLSAVGITPYAVRDTIFVSLIPPMLLMIAAGCGVLAFHLASRGRVGRSEVRPWAALKGFELTDSTRLYGDGSRRDLQRPRAHVLRAEFGTEHTAFEVISTRAPLAEVMELHRLLTRGFVEERDTHLRRIGKAPSAPGTVASVTPGEIPQQLA